MLHTINAKRNSSSYNIAEEYLWTNHERFPGKSSLAKEWEGQVPAGDGKF